MITLPPVFQDAIDPHFGDPNVSVSFILQIGGLGTAYAYGPDEVDFSPAAFWDGVDDHKRPVQVKRHFRIDEATGLPAIQPSGSELDILEGRADLGAMSIELVDTDNELARLQAIRRQDGRRRLARTVGRWETQITLESVTGLSVVPGQDLVLYIDREAMRVEAIVGRTLFVTRGWLRSTAERHGGSDRYGAGCGAIVTTYPRALNERPIWLYYGLNASKLSDCVKLFQGEIRDYGNDGLTVALNCEDGQAKLKQPLFWDLADGWYEDPAIKGPNQPIARVSPDGADSDIRIEHLPADWPYGEVGRRLLFVSGQYIHWAEVTFFGTRYGVTGAYAKTLRAGVWARAFVPPNEFKPARPVILVSAGSADLSQPESSLPWMENYAAEGAPISGYHPLLLMLQILTSTGRYYETRDPTGQNGDFDVLPSSWGLGIAAEDIDVDRILELARRTPDVKIRMAVLDIVEDARDWLTSQFLRPFGFFLNLSADGKITVGSLQEPTPDEKLNLPEITVNDLVIDPATKQFKLLKGPISYGQERAASVRLKDTPRIKDGKLVLLRERTITVAEDAESGALSKSADPIEIEAYSLTTPGELDRIHEALKNDDEAWMNAATAFTEPPNGAYPGRAYISRLLALYQPRYALPPHVVTVKVRPSKWALSLGDRVSVALPHLANPYSAARGWNGVIAEVTKRNVDPMTGDIELELSASMLALMGSRYVAPALKVVNWNSATKIATVASNEFTAAGSFDTRAFIAGVAGVGYPVRVYSRDRLQRSGTVRIHSKPSDTEVELSGVPTMDLSGRGIEPGDIITLAPYSEALATMKARWAYRASTPPSATLGGTDEPHTFV